MEDRGYHYEPTYHIHKLVTKWHSHYGHHAKVMIHWITKLSLEHEVSSRAGLFTFATSQWMEMWSFGYHANTLISSVEQHWNSPFINWGSWLIWVKKQPCRGYGRLLAAAALLMVLKLYIFVKYYYNTLFLFSFYRRSYFLNFFPDWTFMHEKLFYDQSHHFQLEYRQQSIFLAYCCPFLFLRKLSSIQSILSLIHNYLYTLCSQYNHNFHRPIIDMCTLLHLLLYCSFLCLAVSITPFIGFMVVDSLFQLEGGMYALWDSMRYDYCTLP